MQPVVSHHLGFSIQCTDCSYCSYFLFPNNNNSNPTGGLNFFGNKPNNETKTTPNTFLETNKSKNDMFNFSKPSEKNENKNSMFLNQNKNSSNLFNKGK